MTAVEIFEHKCNFEGCDEVVKLDNEPYCSEHSPPGAIGVPGYSARREYRQKLELQADEGKVEIEVEQLKDQKDTEEHHNVFDK